MNYSTYIDNVKMIEWKLSYQEAALVDWFQRLHVWADTIVFNGINYYFASRNKAVEDNPVITEKPDTMYRYYKSLAQKGIILYLKADGKDYIAFTQKGKTWGIIRTSDSNPNELGQASENNSDSNPTYKNTNTNKNTNNKKGKAQKISPTQSPPDDEDLFGKIQKESPLRKSLFLNSAYFEMSIFKSKLKELNGLGVDLEYYHRQIDNWSTAKNQMRTGRGWIATARTWMERDKDAGKLRMIKSDEQINEVDDDMRDYLDMTS